MEGFLGGWGFGIESRTKPPVFDSVWSVEQRTKTGLTGWTPDPGYTEQNVTVPEKNRGKKWNLNILKNPVQTKSEEVLYWTNLRVLGGDRVHRP